MEKTQIIIDSTGIGAGRKEWLIEQIQNSEFSEVFNMNFEIIEGHINT